MSFNVKNTKSPATSTPVSTPSAPKPTAPTSPTPNSPPPSRSPAPSTDKFKTQGPSNPFSWFSPRREAIDKTTQDMKSDYGQQVNAVNYMLDKRKVNISQKTADTVMQNTKAVESGNKSEFTSHLSESRNFGRDAIQSFRDGQYRQGGYEATGSLLNVAGAGYKALITPTPLEKQGISPH